MNIEQIKRLRESEDHIEFKEAKTQFAYKSERRSVLGYAVALANEGGGKLILGVKENKAGLHVITGSNAFEGFEGKLAEDIYTDLRIRVETEVLFEESKRVLVLNIPCKPIGKPLKFQDVALMRVGEQLLPMSDEQFLKIIQELEPDFSAKICEGLYLEDIDVDALEKMKEAYALKQSNTQFRSMSITQVLSDLKLMHGDKLTYAALILLGKRECIDRFLPQAKTVWEFRFTEPQIHSDFKEIIFDPLFKGIDKIWELVNGKNANIPTQSAPYIHTIHAFNEIVIREAILNAITHRDYTINSEVVIKQYPKKIVINNPGGFPKGVTIDNIVTISSTPRSRLMAEILEKTGLVERSGQGVDKIFSITLAEGKHVPSYRDSDYHQVTLVLDANVVNRAFSIFISEIQDARGDDQKLSVEEIIILYKVSTHQQTQIKETPIIEKLIREGLIVRISGRYLLPGRYTELSSREQRIGTRYITAEVEQFALALQNQSSSIGDLEKTLTGFLNRNQIKYLINKLYEDKIVISDGVGRGTRYKLAESYQGVKGDNLISSVFSTLRQKYS